MAFDRRMLTSTQFMLALLEHSPDIFLDEIQEQLFSLHDLDISLSTIWRTLKRLGIISKKVNYSPSHRAGM
jgi:transposase